MPVDSINDLKVNYVVITVMHDVFMKIDLNQIKNMMNNSLFLIDVRGGFRKAASKGFIYRSL